jgi:GIY-YIG catalytic domain
LISFNTLLNDAGIPISETRLVRHQDRSAESGQSLYDIWRSKDGRFELYQRLQKKDRFKGAKHLASFIATPNGETLFVGMYKVAGSRIAAPGTSDPIRQTDVSGHFFYDLQLEEDLNEYADRLTVDWGTGTRAWVQHAASPRPKRILEIRRRAEEPPFPGFRFTWRIPHSWRGALSAASGVYLLVCHTDGKQYVGSAYGTGGFWSRWESYFRNNHGGNEGMKLRKNSDYQVSILEVASSTMSTTDIIELEGYWKEKLLTKTFGLNQN